MVQFCALRDGDDGDCGDRVGLDSAETGSKQDAGERTVVQPTLRKRREGWGTRSVGKRKDVKARRVGHPPQAIYGDMIYSQILAGIGE